MKQEIKDLTDSTFTETLKYLLNDHYGNLEFKDELEASFTVRMHGNKRDVLEFKVLVMQQVPEARG